MKNDGIGWVLLRAVWRRYSNMLNSTLLMDQIKRAHFRWDKIKWLWYMNGSIGWRLQRSGCSKILVHSRRVKRNERRDETRREIITRSFMKNVIAFGEYKRISWCKRVYACTRVRANNACVSVLLFFLWNRFIVKRMNKILDLTLIV